MEEILKEYFDDLELVSLILDLLFVVRLNRGLQIDQRLCNLAEGPYACSPTKEWNLVDILNPEKQINQLLVFEYTENP